MSFYLVSFFFMFFHTEVEQGSSTTIYNKTMRFTINLDLNHSKYVTLSMSVVLMLHLEEKVRKTKELQNHFSNKNLKL